jgi:hypothetical protein
MERIRFPDKMLIMAFVSPAGTHRSGFEEEI